MLRPTRRAFTLVEMLVVIALISILLALLTPAIYSARNSARRIECAARLKQVGLAMETYMDAHGGVSAKYPDSAELPSVTPDRPSITTVLLHYAGEDRHCFACPMDEVFFPKEGISYEYRALQFAAKTRPQAQETFGIKRPSEEVMMMYDFDAFHGSPNQMGSRNVLYMDGHVEPL